MSLYFSQKWMYLTREPIVNLFLKKNFWNLYQKIEHILIYLKLFYLEFLGWIWIFKKFLKFQTINLGDRV